MGGEGGWVGRRVHRTEDGPARWWSTERLFEGVNLNDTSQPGDVFFPATFSCLGAGWKGSSGRVLPEEHGEGEEPGSRSM